MPRLGVWRRWSPLSTVLAAAWRRSAARAARGVRCGSQRRHPSARPPLRLLPRRRPTRCGSVRGCGSPPAMGPAGLTRRGPLRRRGWVEMGVKRPMSTRSAHACTHGRYSLWSADREGASLGEERATPRVCLPIGYVPAVISLTSPRHHVKVAAVHLAPHQAARCSSALRSLHRHPPVLRQDSVSRSCRYAGGSLPASSPTAYQKSARPRRPASPSHESVSVSVSVSVRLERERLAEPRKSEWPPTRRRWLRAEPGDPGGSAGCDARGDRGGRGDRGVLRARGDVGERGNHAGRGLRRPPLSWAVASAAAPSGIVCSLGLAMGRGEGKGSRLKNRVIGEICPSVKAVGRLGSVQDTAAVLCSTPAVPACEGSSALSFRCAQTTARRSATPAPLQASPSRAACHTPADSAASGVVRCPTAGRRSPERFASARDVRRYAGGQPRTCHNHTWTRAFGDSFELYAGCIRVCASHPG